MKPSVLFFCPTFTAGGVEKVLVNLANYFCKTGFSTSFLVCQRIGELEGHLNGEIKIESFNKRLSGSFWPAVKFFRAHNPDIIICGPQFINILAVLVIKLLLRKNSKVVLTHHSFYDLDVQQMPFLKLFYKSFLKIFYKHSDVVVAVSNAVKSHLVNDIGLKEEKIKVIYNPVLEDNFEALKQEEFYHKWLIPGKQFKVLVCAGRLSKVKNQEALIRLFPALIKKNNCKLILLGDGDQRSFLEGLVSELALSDYVDLVGSVINPVKYIAESDLLLLPSVSETFSLVAVESIAAGTPVLSTHTLGVKEILGNCRGCFFESIENPEDYIQKIKQILNTEKIEVDQDFTDKFKISAIGQLYVDLILQK